MSAAPETTVETARLSGRRVHHGLISSSTPSSRLSATSGSARAGVRATTVTCRAPSWVAAMSAARPVAPAPRMVTRVSGVALTGALPRSGRPRRCCKPPGASFQDQRVARAGQPGEPIRVPELEDSNLERHGQAEAAP